MRELLLILTAGCNLRCSYCYQEVKEPRSMAWPVLQAALDVLLARPAAAVNVSFYGGEPMLESASLRRAVDYLGARAAGRRITWHVTTNGVLLGREDLAFLAGRDFLVDLSMDGAAASQELRHAGTFAALDGLLGLWRSEFRSHFDRRCRVAVTVTQRSIPHLAASFAYLLDKHVPAVALQPIMGGETWSEEDLAALDLQLAAMRERSVGDCRRAGHVALTAFAPDLQGPAREWAGDRGCIASRGELLAVDVDGEAYACALAARSYQRFDSPDVDHAMRRLALGNVADPAFSARLDALPAVALESGVFTPRSLQQGCGTPCAACADRDDCFVCPIVRIRHAPAGAQGAVPAHLCAFNRLMAKHRRQFRAQTGGEGMERLFSWLFNEGAGSS